MFFFMIPKWKIQLLCFLSSNLTPKHIFRASLLCRKLLKLCFLWIYFHWTCTVKPWTQLSVYSYTAKTADNGPPPPPTVWKLKNVNSADVYEHCHTRLMTLLGITVCAVVTMKAAVRRSCRRLVTRDHFKIGNHGSRTLVIYLSLIFIYTTRTRPLWLHNHFQHHWEQILQSLPVSIE